MSASDRPPPPRAHSGVATKSARKNPAALSPDLDTDNDPLDAFESGDDDESERVVAAGPRRYAVKSVAPSGHTSGSAHSRMGRLVARTAAVKSAPPPMRRRASTSEDEDEDEEEDDDEDGSGDGGDGDNSDNDEEQARAVGAEEISRRRVAAQAARKSASTMPDSLFTDGEEGGASGGPGSGGNGERKTMAPSTSAVEAARKTAAGPSVRRARKPNFLYAKTAAKKSAAPPSIRIASDDDDERPAAAFRPLVAKTGARKTARSDLLHVGERREEGASVARKRAADSLNPQRATKAAVKRVAFYVPEDEDRPQSAGDSRDLVAPRQARQGPVKSATHVTKGARKLWNSRGRPARSNEVDHIALPEERRAFGQPPNPPDARAQRASKTNQLRPLFSYSVAALAPSEDALPSEVRRKKIAQKTELTTVGPSDERYYRKFVGKDMILARVGGGQDELTNPDMFGEIIARRKAARKFLGDEAVEYRDAVEDPSSSSDESPSESSKSGSGSGSKPQTSSSSSEDDDDMVPINADLTMGLDSSPPIGSQPRIQTSATQALPPDELVRALEPIILGPMRLRRARSLPFLLRNARQGFEFKCKLRKVDTTTQEFPPRPVTVVYTLPLSSGLGNACEWRTELHEWVCQFCDIHGRFPNRKMFEAHYRWDHAEVGVRWDVGQNVLSLTIPRDERSQSGRGATSVTHLLQSSPPPGDPMQASSPSAQSSERVPISVPPNTSVVRLSQAPMNARRAMSVVPMPNSMVSEEPEVAPETSLPISTGSPETRATSTSMSVVSSTTRAASATLSLDARNTLSPPSFPESSVTTGTISSLTLLSAEPEEEKKPKLEDLAWASRITTTSSQARFSSTSTLSPLPSSKRTTPGTRLPHGGLLHARLGPAAQHPYLPETINGRAYYSCRPGGPRLYDLLNTLSLEPYGILSWSIIDREEELFEMDDIRDEDKVMAALWMRWAFLHRNGFVANSFENVKEFVKTNCDMIYKAAGIRALRVWLLGLASHDWLTAKEIGTILRYYDELLSQAPTANLTGIRAT